MNQEMMQVLQLLSALKPGSTSMAGPPRGAMRGSPGGSAISASVGGGGGGGSPPPPGTPPMVGSPPIMPPTAPTAAIPGMPGTKPAGTPAGAPPAGATPPGKPPATSPLPGSGGPPTGGGPGAAPSGPPKVTAQMLNPKLQEELSLAQLAFDEANMPVQMGQGVMNDIQNKKARRKLPEAIKRLTAAKVAVMNPQLQVKAQSQQNRVDGVYKMGLILTKDPNAARQMATESITNPEVGLEMVKTITKQPDMVSNMQKEYEWIMKQPDGPERDDLLEKFYKQEETIMKMPLEFGYMYDKNGEIVLTPGEDNPKRIEMQLAQAEILENMHMANKHQRDAMMGADNAISEVKRTMGLVGATTTGLIGSILAKIPGTDARALATTLKTQQAFVGFDTLRMIRENSKTGGGLGNISNVELELLYNAWTALDPNLPADELERSLANLLYRFEGAKFALENESKWKDDEAGGAEMTQAIYDHVNGMMRESTNVSEEDWNALMADPGSLLEFEDAYGWKPRL
jgi:hypothetical protein